MIRKLRDDSGMVMVTAIMAGLVVLALSTAGFAMATHNLDQSAGHRRGVQSVHASEAGLDRFLDYLANSAPIGAPVCTLATEDLSTTPSTTFAATTTYYATSDGTGTPLGSPSSCPGAFTSIPLSAVITSQGTSGGRTRTMQTLVELLPNNGAAMSAYAVHANGSASWGGHASVSNAAGTEFSANLYSKDDLELKGGATIHGQAESLGSITLTGNAEVKRFVTARNNVTMSNNSIVRGDVRAASGTLSSGGQIGGNAYYCAGSAPGGTVAGSKVQECKPTEPAEQTFQTFSYDATQWQNDGFTINTYTTCASAQSFLDDLPAGNHVVRLESTCELTIPSVTLGGNLAIITNGSLKSTGITSFTRTGTSPPYTLMLMANVLNSPAVTGGPACGTNDGITLAAGTSFPSGVDVLFYTACHVKFTGNATANIHGQIVAGGNVDFKSGSNLTYKPVLIPTINPIGFRESVRYRSEIVD